MNVEVIYEFKNKNKLKEVQILGRIKYCSVTYINDIGLLRVKKRGLSFRSNKLYNKGFVSDVSSQSQSLAILLARIISAMVVNNFNCEVQKISDTRKEVEKWLTEDGLTERMTKDMFDHVHVSKVMES